MTSGFLRYGELPDLSGPWEEYGKKCAALRKERDLKLKSVGAASIEAIQVIEDWRADLAKAWSEYHEVAGSLIEMMHDARPNMHFAAPPYRAELFNEKTGWSGVMNANGINCLTFKSKPGAVISDFETCSRLARKWNSMSIAGGIQA